MIGMSIMSVKKALLHTDFSKASDLLLNYIPKSKTLDAEEIILGMQSM